MIKEYRLPILFFPVVACVGMLIGGCSVAMKYDISQPQSRPSDVQSVVKNDYIQLRVLDLNLSIQVQNYRYTGYSLFSPLLPLPLIPLLEKEGEVHSPLQIWLSIWLEEGTGVTGNETLSLDPERVLLKAEDETRHSPIAFIGPDKPWESPRAVGRGCGARRYSFGVAESRMDIQRGDIKNINGGPVLFKQRTKLLRVLV